MACRLHRAFWHCPRPGGAGGRGFLWCAHEQYVPCLFMARTKNSLAACPRERMERAYRERRRQGFPNGPAVRASTGSRLAEQRSALSLGAE